MKEREKYEMIYRECERYGKDWERAGRVHKELIKKHLPKGESVWDFGAGNGSCVRWLKSTGRPAVGIDIAGNIVRPDLGIVQGDLRTPTLDLFPRDNGTCVDVMEHIPTEDVHVVLSNIAAAVKSRVYFHIALGPDRDGDEFGVQLHMTQRPPGWWRDMLEQHWDVVNEVNALDGRFVTFICAKV